MADVTGPISTLPGAVHNVPTGMVCDDHSDRPAYRRVQGETDSMGSEMHDMCEECFTKYQADIAEADTSGCCEWCKTHKPKLRDRRDFEEGSCGPVYQVCDDCIKAEYARLARDIADDDSYYGRDDPLEYDDD